MEIRDCSVFHCVLCSSMYAVKPTLETVQSYIHYLKIWKKVEQSDGDPGMTGRETGS